MAGGFKDTAEYFRTRGQKSRDYDQRQRFLDQARFYRQLADIVPTFPVGYKEPRFTGDHFRNRAEECRAIADSFRDPECKRRLLDLANQYDLRAIAAE